MFRDEVAVGGAVVSVVLWDTGGALQLQRLGTPFFHRANCVLLLADLVDPGAALTVTDASWLSSCFHPGTSGLHGCGTAGMPYCQTNPM